MTPEIARFGAIWAISQLLCVVSAILLLRTVTQFPVEPGLRPLASAERVEASGARVHVVLPDDWRLWQSQDNKLHYRLTFDRPGDVAGTLAVLVPSVRMNMTAMLNGQALPGDADAGSPSIRLWTLPALFDLPATALRARDNQLELTVNTEPAGRGYLSVPLLGERALAVALAQRIEFLRHSCVQWLIVAMFTVSAGLLVIWLRRRQEAIYGWYGLGMGLWALHNLNFVVVDPWLPVRYWDTAAYLSLGLFVWATMFFIHHYLKRRQPVLEQTVTGFVFIVGVALCVAPGDWPYLIGDRIWNPAVLLLGLYLNLYMHWESWRRRDYGLLTLATAGVPMVLYGAHDFPIAAALAPWGFGYSIHFSAIFPLLTFTLLLVRRFVQSLEISEATVRELDERVAAKSHQIALQAERMHTLEQAQRIAAERERIARDIHDGVGGRLIALISRAALRPPPLSALIEAVREALADLRLVVLSLDLPGGDVQAALAGFRHRAEERLRDTGFSLEWNMPELPTPAPPFGPSQLLDLLRILDEVVTNALRHSGGTRLHISGNLECGALVLTVIDDGRGMPVAAGHGHGLRNMRARAARLGAEIEIDRPASGTRIRIVIGYPT